MNRSRNWLLPLCAVVGTAALCARLQVCVGAVLPLLFFAFVAFNVLISGDD